MDTAPARARHAGGGGIWQKQMRVSSWCSEGNRACSLWEEWSSHPGIRYAMPFGVMMESISKVQVLR